MDPPVDVRTAVLHSQRKRLIKYILATLTLLFAAASLKPLQSQPTAIHTSILTGQGWVDELVLGHRTRMLHSLGMAPEVFLELIKVMRTFGLTDSRWVTLEEQLAILLHASVTGLTIRHLCERFQRSNPTIL